MRKKKCAAIEAIETLCNSAQAEHLTERKKKCAAIEAIETALEKNFGLA